MKQFLLCFRAYVSCQRKAHRSSAHIQNGKATALFLSVEKSRGCPRAFIYFSFFLVAAGLNVSIIRAVALLSIINQGLVGESQAKSAHVDFPREWAPLV